MACSFLRTGLAPNYAWGCRIHRRTRFSCLAPHILSSFRALSSVAEAGWTGLVTAEISTLSPDDPASDASVASHAGGAAASEAPEANIGQNTGAGTTASHASATKQKKVKARPPLPTIIHPPSLPSKDDPVWANAAFLIDKPVEWTSFDVCKRLKSSLDIKKIGHTGTLDPLATGLLVVCVGRGTKSVDRLMAEDKVYSGIMRLGQHTPSFDREMDVTETAPWEHISDEQLQDTANAHFVGEISQLPPKYSAIRVNGVRMYDSARAEEEVVSLERAVRVEEFRVWRTDKTSQDVNYYVRCSKGTYVRSLIHDLGRKVGSLAFVAALRRESSGSFDVKDAWQLDALVADGVAKGMSTYTKEEEDLRASKRPHRFSSRTHKAPE